MSKLSAEKKIDLSEKNLERVNLWISHADQKIGIALLFQAGLTAFLTTSKADDIKKILLTNCNLLSTFLLFSLILFAFFIIRGAYYSFKALYPDIRVRGSSLFFFGSIVSLGASKFKKEFSSLTNEEAEKDLNNQVFINSEIAALKFQNIKVSIFSTGLAAIFWALSLILISYLK